MGVLDLTDGELAQHAFILRYFVLFELVNGYETMLDGNEVDQTAVVIDAVAGRLDVGLESELGIVFASFGLEEVPQGGLTGLKLIQLRLIVASFILAPYLLLHDVLTAHQCVQHSLHVQLLAHEPHQRLTVRVLDVSKRVNHVLLHIACFRLRQGALVHVAVGEIINSDFLVLHERVVHLDLLFDQFFMGCGHRSQRFFGFLHHQVGLAEEHDELAELFAVFGDLCGVLLLIYLKV